MYQDSSQKAEDAILLRQLNEGSKRAFDILYDKYWKQVFNAAYKRLNDVDYAQDIAQDVFIQLWIRDAKTPIDNLPAYLFVAARNSVFKHLEKQGKFTPMPDLLHQMENPLERADADVLYEEFLESFNALINALPPQQQVIFRMRFEEDLSSTEIAAQLQISPKTVRNQLGRALATLRSSLLLLQFLMLLYRS